MLEQPQFPSDFRQKKRALSARPSHQETIFEMAHMVKLFAQLDPISITKNMIRISPCLRATSR